MRYNTSTIVVEGSATTTADPVATFGGLFVGFILSTTLYGLTFFQTYLYFSRYSKDAIWVKTLIALLWGIDTATTGLLSHTVYTYLLTDFNVPFETLGVTSTLCAENGLTIVATFLVQLYYASRIWSSEEMFSLTLTVACLTTFRLLFISKKKNGLASGAVVALAIPAFAFGIIATINLFREMRIEAFVGGILKLSTAANSGLAFLCDVAITGALFYYIHPARNQTVKLPTSFFEKAIVYTINRGTITAILQLAFFIAFFSDPSALVWLPFPIMLGKVYVNVLLVMLNYRECVDGHGLFEEDVVVAGANSGYLSNIRFAVPTLPRGTTAKDSHFKVQSTTIELHPLDSDGTTGMEDFDDSRKFTSSSQTRIFKS